MNGGELRAEGTAKAYGKGQLTGVKKDGRKKQRSGKYKMEKNVEIGAKHTLKLGNRQTLDVVLLLYPPASHGTQPRAIEH